MTLRYGAETPKLVARLEDLIAHGDVQDDGAADTYPNEKIVRINTNIVPITVDPAPYLLTLSVVVVEKGEFIHGRFAIDETSCRMANEEQREGDDERPTVADDTVEPPPFLEGVGACAEEEYEEDVDGHSEGPPGVRLHEPAHH